MVSEILEDPGYLFEKIFPDVAAAGSGVRYQLFLIKTLGDFECFCRSQPQTSVCVPLKRCEVIEQRRLLCSRVFDDFFDCDAGCTESFVTYIFGLYSISEFLGMYCGNGYAVLRCGESDAMIGFGGEVAVFEIPSANHSQSRCLYAAQRVITPFGGEGQGLRCVNANQPVCFPPGFG